MIECYTVQMLKKLNEETGALIHWCCIFSRIIESMKNSFLFLYILFHIFQSSRLADALDARTSHQIETSSRLTSDRNQLGPHIRQEPARTLRSKAITAKSRSNQRWRTCLLNIARIIINRAEHVLKSKIRIRRQTTWISKTMISKKDGKINLFKSVKIN